MLNQAREMVLMERRQPIWLPWVVCFAGTLIFFYEFIQGNMFASLAQDIMREFHLEARQMAYLSSIYYLSNVLFLPFAGMILDRYSIRKTIMLVMILTVGSTFVFAQVHSFTIGMICRFIMGIGSGFCFLGPVRLASQWFPPKKMAMITGMIVTMAMTGGLVAQYPLTWLIEHHGWRHALMEVGYLGILMIGIMAVFMHEKPLAANHDAGAQFKAFAAIKHAYLSLKNARAALYTSLMNMVIAVLGAMMGTMYLVKRLNIGIEQASLINSMLFLGAILGGPLMGWLSDRLQLRILPMKLGALASLMTVVIVLYVPVGVNMMMFLFFTLGLLTSTQVISYAYVAENNPPAITATALSLISIVTQGGYLIYQNLFTWLMDGHGVKVVVDGVTEYSLGSYQYASSIFIYGLLIAALITVGMPESIKRNWAAK